MQANDGAERGKATGDSHIIRTETNSWPTVATTQNLGHECVPVRRGGAGEENAWKNLQRYTDLFGMLGTNSWDGLG